MSQEIRPFLILGTNSSAEALVDFFEDQPGITIVGFVENRNRALAGQTLLGRPIYWDDDIARFRDTHHLVCALSTTLRQNWIATHAASGFEFASLIHASAVISKSTALARGVIVKPGAVIAGFSVLQDHVRIGRNATIGHHTRIGRFSTIHPGAVVSGNCSLGACVTVGAGATIVDGIDVGEEAFVAAGATVIADVPPRALVAGRSAKVLRRDYGPK